MGYNSVDMADVHDEYVISNFWAINVNHIFGHISLHSNRSFFHNFK